MLLVPPLPFLHLSLVPLLFSALVSILFTLRQDRLREAGSAPEAHLLVGLCPGSSCGGCSQSVSSPR